MYRYKYKYFHYTVNSITVQVLVLVLVGTATLIRFRNTDSRRPSYVKVSQTANVWPLIYLPSAALVQVQEYCTVNLVLYLNLTVVVSLCVVLNVVLNIGPLYIKYYALVYSLPYAKEYHVAVYLVQVLSMYNSIVQRTRYNRFESYRSCSAVL
jgi:hypothetical protein